MGKEIRIHAGEIELIAVDDLKPRPNNRNHHPQDQLDRLAMVFKSNGFRNPIIVSNRSGQIVCGTGRYLAALRAGLKEVPVIYQDYDSDAQEYAHHVADNGLSLWSELDLAGISNDLGDLGPDFDIDSLGLKNFALDFAEKEFDPSADDGVDESDAKTKVCPECGHEF